MAIATHLIKIKGSFNEKEWTEEKIRNLVERKIQQEVERFYYPDLELFQVTNNNIEVWVFVSAFPSEVTNEIIEKWLQDHVKEEGIEVKDFEIKEMISFSNFNDKPEFFIITQTR
jgi:hypothetical protein